MTIYHETVWNYDSDPADIQHAADIGQPTMDPYIADGYCSSTDFYWEPGKPQGGGGLFTIRRVWTDYSKLTQWITEINAIRAADPIISAVCSDAAPHNDNNYNPPA